ncbi:aminopeptidase P N-terminal domain-containing protein [Undibacterium sp. Ji50W]|uniref:aminopeptidase P N-terminal domain-containing protein n=1 Tax=Undibacterium sp. Ji50W TaxID=3413041 RepID=UPI003BF227DB
MSEVPHPSHYAARRARLIAHMRAQGGGVAIIANAPEVIRNRDVEYPYRHDSYFYYLSGFSEPDAIIVIVVGEQAQSILFCRDKDAEQAIWHGFRHGPEGAREHFGFNAAYSLSTLDNMMPTLIKNVAALYHAQGSNAALDARVQTWMHAVRLQARTGVRAPAHLHDVHAVLNEMRIIKDSAELAIMRHAASISAQAHCRVMRFTRPGQTEYQLEAELLHEFHRQGATAPAYPAIVAAGAHACVLHHNPSATLAQAGELILVDAGCEYQGYASDITRTFPATGKFTAAQETMYELVLAAQLAAIAAVRPGASFMAPHDAAVRVLAAGMLTTSLLDSQQCGTVEDVIANGDYRQFFMCRTSHWIGMDVHDAGDYLEPVNGIAQSDKEIPWRILRPGMSLTIEPGIYVRPTPGVPEQYWNIGIRIEDDVVVTDDGCEILSSAVPKTVAAIEELMAG